MPKQKTKRSAAKRFSMTGTGKYKFQRARKRHNLTDKPTAFKRDAKKPGYLSPGDAKLARILLPHGC
jgi:large subunit ribosomal protein L35